MVALSNTIAIIGAGSVGAAIAFTLVSHHTIRDIVLIDVNRARCRAQVQDLSDGAFLSGIRVREGSFQEAGQCDVIIITAGAKQCSGESMADLAARNIEILKSVLRDISPLREDAILLIVTDPVDILTLCAQTLSGLPRAQVIGSGTSLDTARLRILLAGEAQASFT